MNRLGSVNTPRTQAEILAVIDHKTIPEPNSGCVLWTASVDKNGYGKIFYQGNYWRTHRLVYAIHKNVELTPKDFIQHKCDTPGCCNLDHLEMGNALTNMQDKVAKGRLRNQHMGITHCKRGHEFSSENTKVEPNGRRTCITCRRARAMGYKMKKSKNCSNGKTDSSESTR